MYGIESDEFFACLERNNYSSKTMAEHRRLFAEMEKHLVASGATFSMDTAVDWLESRKADWSWDTYKRYRRALYRFGKYLANGSIKPEAHCHNNYFAYHDADVSYIKLTGDYKALYRDFHSAASDCLCKATVDHYVAGCTDFLLFISEKGCNSPAELSMGCLIEYLRQIQNSTMTEETKQKHASGVAKLMSYLSEKGYVPQCYSYIAGESAFESIVTQLATNVEAGVYAVFQPSKQLEPLAELFLSRLEERRYSEKPKKLYGYVFVNFFLFLEINRIECSSYAIDLWLEQARKFTTWRTKRNIIKWFNEFLSTGSADKDANTVYKPLLIDTLPNWGRSIINDYLKLRQREGCAHSTLQMCRSSCVRFFQFLDSKDVGGPGEITALLVKEFHNTDPHATPEGRNAYGVRIRRLLVYMAEQGLAPQNLYLAISTQCSSRRKIISVMSEDMIAAVYHYRETAVCPIGVAPAKREKRTLRNYVDIKVGST